MMEIVSGARRRPPWWHRVAASVQATRARVAGQPWQLLAANVGRRLLLPFPDRVYLKLGHLVYFGRWPDYTRPTTFNERIQEYMLRCRDPLLQRAADKVACRDYVAERVGAQYLVPLLGVWDDAEDVPLATLPRPFVLKPSAASGAVLLVKENDTRTHEQLRAEMRRWLRRDYSRLHREWAYRDLPRRIMAERMLLDETNEPPTDYKAYVIGGVMRYFHVDHGRFQHHTRNLYTRDWQFMPVRWTLENHPPEPAPAPLREMVRLAEEIARPFEFLRVDFYALKDKIYVGELTNYPGAGFERFIPGDYAKVVATWWKTPDGGRRTRTTASR